MLEADEDVVSANPKLAGAACRPTAPIQTDALSPQGARQRACAVLSACSCMHVPTFRSKE
jgi:hypothetical protein